MSDIFIEAIDLNTGESVNRSSYNNHNSNDVFIEHINLETGEYKNNRYSNKRYSNSKIVTLVENFDTTAWVDLNESEAELLDMLSENVDRLHEEYLDECMSLGLDEGALNELSVYDIKDKAKKAWDAIVDFFKRAIQYIQKKIRGQMDNLSVEKGEENGEKFIAFYAKARRIKKLNYDDNDKFNVVDVEEVYKNLSFIVVTLNNNALEGNDADDADKKLSKEYKDSTDLDRFKKEGISGEMWASIREDIFKKNVKVNEIDTYLTNINKYYQKAIDVIHKVGKSAIKRAKKTPNRTAYKLYLNAKHIASMSLNINSLIKISNDN